MSVARFILCTVPIAPYFILTAMLRGGYDYSHFIDEKIEKQRGYLPKVKQLEPLS